MNEARKQRDSARTILLSTILADIKNREFELQHSPSDDEVVEVLRRGIKRRREAAEAYTAAKRPDVPTARLCKLKPGFAPRLSYSEAVRPSNHCGIATRCA